MAAMWIRLKFRACHFLASVWAGVKFGALGTICLWLAGIFLGGGGGVWLAFIHYGYEIYTDLGRLPSFNMLWHNERNITNAMSTPAATDVDDKTMIYPFFILLAIITVGSIAFFALFMLLCIGYV